ncbi:MAG: hypothetical protein JW860_13565 [Sedimentisphaerales bacterium]|nr:hypothetical protein [Sedimentisphaerales bacterium]
MYEFINSTELNRAADWICQRLEQYDTTKLRLHLKRHRRRDQVFSGYCRYEDFLVIAAIHEKLPLPFCLCKPISTRPNRRRRRGFDYIWHEMPVYTEEQALVWVTGHECWHYLCKTKQLKGNWETRANKYGFQWLDEFNHYATEHFGNTLKIIPSFKAKKLKIIYG